MKRIVVVAAALLSLGLLAVGCTNVNQMRQRYLAGDTAQLDRLADLVSQPEYPYATRRKAARVLGELGDRRAVPVLVGVLSSYDQRTTLKEEAVYALGRLGDPSAVGPIGRMLDTQLDASGVELRQAALKVLGQLGTPNGAEVLVNALRYYDALMARQEQSMYRGVFSGAENAYRPQPMAPDSSGQVGRGPQMGMGMGALTEATSLPPSFFGVGERAPETYDPTPAERRMAHASLVQIGPAAVPVLTQFVNRRETTLSLRQELLAIVREITGAPAVIDSAAVPPVSEGAFEVLPPPPAGPAVPRAEPAAVPGR